MMQHSKAILGTEKIGNCAVNRKYTVSEACVCHSWSIKTKLFSCLTNGKSFSGQRKGTDLEIDASVLQNFGLYKIKDSL
jgi:hypothetical protein